VEEADRRRALRVRGDIRTTLSMGPLTGFTVLEMAGMGPGPVGAMLLSDMGAETIRLERPEAMSPRAVTDRPIDFVKLRGRRSIAIDLKHPEAAEIVLRLVERADAFIEGFRPGVVDRLGIGPEPCLARNPRLVYAHVTGWGQGGPLAQAAGHDINYLALSGVLSAIGPHDGEPVPPLNLVGDGGGGMLLAFAVVCGLLEASRSGQGQVVDAAMIDGALALGAIFHGLSQIGRWRPERGTNLLDGGAPFYAAYETADGRWVAVGAIEPKFYAQLLEGLGLDAAELPDQYDERAWPDVRRRLAARFKERTLAEWVRIMDGRDTCFTPVLTFVEAPEHPHNAARGAFVPVDGVLQPAAAPRFGRTPGTIAHGAVTPGQDTCEVLSDFGFTNTELRGLLRAGTIAQPQHERAARGPSAGRSQVLDTER
jgi:alpha-methylacyl-CoA racemase